jgi:hypothetical protein
MSRQIAIREFQGVSEVGEVRPLGLGEDREDPEPDSLMDHVVQALGRV